MKDGTKIARAPVVRSENRSRQTRNSKANKQNPKTERKVFVVQLCHAKIMREHRSDDGFAMKVQAVSVTEKFGWKTI